MIWLFSDIFASFFLGSFVSLLTIINPPSAIPLFTSLSAHLDDAETEKLARRGALYAFAILTVSLVAGSLILNTFGISYGALRIAGGIVVALLGHSMLFGREQVRSGPAIEQPHNPAFFPLALPGLSGPGTIAVVIGISTEIRELGGWGGVAIAGAGTVAAMAATCLLIWLTLRSARQISNRLGRSGIEAMTRLMGFLLICIGVQFIASGIRTFVSGI
jgi:multiple antibiotic resistance protein